MRRPIPSGWTSLVLLSTFANDGERIPLAQQAVRNLLRKEQVSRQWLVTPGPPRSDHQRSGGRDRAGRTQ